MYYKAIGTNKVFIFLTIFFLNMFDGIFTYFSLFKTDKNFIELNPFINYLIENLGAWFLLPKILIGLICGIVLAKYCYLNDIVKYSTFFIIILYLIVDLYHIFNLVTYVVN